MFLGFFDFDVDLVYEKRNCHILVFHLFSTKVGGVLERRMVKVIFNRYVLNYLDVVPDF